MKTNDLNENQQELSQPVETGQNGGKTKLNEETGRDEADQSDFPDTHDLDEELSDNGLTDEQDQTEIDHSANDADGNGGYPDVANPAELNS
jgi:hypothetical protein